MRAGPAPPHQAGSGASAVSPPERYNVAFVACGAQPRRSPSCPGEVAGDTAKALDRP